MARASTNTRVIDSDALLSHTVCYCGYSGLRNEVLCVRYATGLRVYFDAHEHKCLVQASDHLGTLEDLWSQEATNGRPVPLLEHISQL